MQPDPFARMCPRSLYFLIRVLGKALVHGMQIQGLLLSAPAQLAQQQRTAQGHGDAIKRKQHAER